MNLNETKQILGILKANYPQSFYNWTSEQSKNYLMLWAEAFKDEDVKTVISAVKAIVYSDTREFAPNLGQVKTKIYELTTPSRMTEQEAWTAVYKAIENSGYHAEEEFKKLPKIIQRIVGAPSVLKEWGMTPTQEVNTVIASNFQRSYRNAMQDDKTYNALPNSVKNVIGHTGNAAYLTNKQK